ncbi:MAG TPA: hypothetical protein VFI96_00915, partial [Longimicrobiaceae bacterium]|nr:hypothetical protein [Longimicrobiaceae bacterium]
TRSYREPLSAEQARQIMREDNGSFDPDVFAIFEDLYPQFEVMVAGVHAARMPRADHPANTPPA